MSTPYKLVEQTVFMRDIGNNMDVNCKISQILRVKMMENAKNGENCDENNNNGYGQAKSNLINIGQPSYFKHGNLGHVLKTKRNILMMADDK